MRYKIDRDSIYLNFYNNFFFDIASTISNTIFANGKIQRTLQNDTMRGGEGNDESDGGKGDDILDGKDGNDKIKGGGGSDRINGGIDNDQLEGEKRNDE